MTLPDPDTSQRIGAGRLHAQRITTMGSSALDIHRERSEILWGFGMRYRVVMRRRLVVG